MKPYIITIINIILLILSIVIWIDAPYKTKLTSTDTDAAWVTVRNQAIQLCHGKWDGTLSEDNNQKPEAGCN